ncbi:MAG: hypothetical protein N2317_00825 [Syntrophales bacterium]|nr:hypothetical protein [Syntrophales bacterium]
MDPKNFMKQILEFNRLVFDRSFNFLVMTQDQGEKIFNTWMEQARFIPEEGKKAIAEWVKAYKSSRDEFKKRVDEAYKRLEDYFSSFASSDK